MNSYKVVKVGLLGTQLDHSAIALGNLPSIRSQVVKSNNLFLQNRPINKAVKKSLKSIAKVTCCDLTQTNLA